jgi:HSP20 family protein
MANSLITWDPFRELDDMTDRMNRVLTRGLTGAAQWAALPATDIYEEDGKMVIETALPQFKDNEVDVQINQDRLEIKAEHSTENESKERNYLRRESSQSSYYRAFALPADLDVEGAQARFENGVLKVDFPKKNLPQPKKLELKSGKQLTEKSAK